LRRFKHHTVLSGSACEVTINFELESSFMNEAAVFGLTMLIAGLGGTLLTLSLMALAIRMLTVVFPVKKSSDQETKP